MQRNTVRVTSASDMLANLVTDSCIDLKSSMSEGASYRLKEAMEHAAQRSASRRGKKTAA